MGTMKNKTWYGSITKRSVPSSASSDEGNGGESQPLIAYGDGETPNDVYPEASEDQLELLTLMDDVIGKAKDEEALVCLQPLTADQVRERRQEIAKSNTRNDENLSESVFGFFCTSFFGLPLLAFIFTIGLAMGTIIGIDQTNFFPTKTQRDLAFDRLLFPIFPCCAAFIGFLACYAASRIRISRYSKEIDSCTGLASIKRALSDAIEHWMITVISKIDAINMKLSLVVDTIDGQFAKVMKQKRKINRLDPNILAEIPTNPSTYVSRELEGAKDELRTSIIMFELEPSFDEDVSTWVPSHLHSKRAYLSRQSVKTVLVCFILHGLGAYGVYYGLTKLSISIILKNQYMITFTELVMPLSKRLTGQVVLWLAAFALEQYIMSNLIVGWVYFSMSSVSRTVAISNQLRSKVVLQTNLLLRQHGIVFLSRDILELRMERVKRKVLSLIHLNIKLDMIWTIIGEKSSQDVRSTPSSSTHGGREISPSSSSSPPPGLAAILSSSASSSPSAGSPLKEGTTGTWKQMLGNWKRTAAATQSRWNYLEKPIEEKKVEWNENGSTRNKS